MHAKWDSRGDLVGLLIKNLHHHHYHCSISHLTDFGAILIFQNVNLVQPFFIWAWDLEEDFTTVIRMGPSVRYSWSRPLLAGKLPSIKHFKGGYRLGPFDPYKRLGLFITKSSWVWPCKRRDSGTPQISKSSIIFNGAPDVPLAYRNFMFFLLEFWILTT